MSSSTKDELGRPPDISPEAIHAAMREAHRLRAETARDLFGATAAGMARAWSTARDVLAHAPGRRSWRQLHTKQ